MNRTHDFMITRRSAAVIQPLPNFTESWLPPAQVVPVLSSSQFLKTLLTVADQSKSLAGQLGGDYEYCTTCYKVSESLDGQIDNLWPPTITAVPSRAWIAITLPETVIIRRVKAYTYEVKMMIKYRILI